MGWDYWTYMAQPSWFIDLMKIRESEQARSDKKEERKMKQSTRVK